MNRAMTAHRLTYQDKQKPIIEACTLNAITPQTVTVKTLYSGISRGTESLVFNGKVPQSEYARMRCPHQVGDFPFPVSYGYASVGEVIEKGDAVDQLSIGDMAFVLHPHQDIFTVDQGMCNLLPKTLPPSRAVLSANMETALNAVWDADLPQAGNFSVIGAGVVGLLTGFVIKRLTNITPTIIDVNPDKHRIAEQLGLHFENASNIELEQFPEQARVFNTSASGAGLQAAIGMAGFEAKIIEMSWYGEKPVTLSLGGSFHSKRLQIISSQVGHVSPSKRANTNYKTRMQQALMLLDNPVLDILLEPEIEFEALPSHLHKIFSAQSDALCQLVKYKTK